MEFFKRRSKEKDAPAPAVEVADNRLKDIGEARTQAIVEKSLRTHLNNAGAEIPPDRMDYIVGKYFTGQTGDLTLRQEQKEALANFKP